ncbi:hypothetical protein AJ80_06355 [Polytolypa hystricis UAMH7299]|uniref:DUF7580 domain-containing protein n=1 Tax=Polytolypa hystricis (strain UAMH7299) TaxID=1447883 RepID=A0A2B7XX70_POLH7|nr:hypothetical protein AJ80_06355 [Polytolypa hystricis UAMH7299]
MSGIETAGLVLAVMPLIISAIENYESVIEPARAFLKWRGQLSDAIRELYLGRTTYDQTIRLLLMSIINQEDLDQMMDDPTSEHWKDNELAANLRLKLKKSYDPCMLTIKEIEGIMITIAECLNIDGSHQVTQYGLGSVVLANPPQSGTPILFKKFQFRNRVKFSMKRQRVRSLLERLDKCNTRLQNYTETAAKLAAGEEEEPYQVHARVKFTAPLGCIQDNATKLHQALSRNWCTSHQSHRACLLLEQHLVRRKKHPKLRVGKSVAVAEAGCFGVCLSPNPKELKWIEGEFRLTKTEIDVKGPTTVVISIDGEKEPEEPPPSVEKGSQPQEISDICATIQTASLSCIGFYFDEIGTLRRGLPTQRTSSYVDKLVTLGDLLPNVQGRLAIEELYTLSITLTASLLQLGPTPWLDDVWCKSGIAFLRTNTSSHTLIDVKHPYLVHTYEGSMTNSSDQTISRANDRSKLLALAIMLLEINFSQTIETFHRPEDLGPNNLPTELTDLAAASRWLMEQKGRGNLSRAFSSAITYCLQSYVNPQASFLDERFCKAMEEQVLIRLEEEMQFLLPE